MRAAPPPPHSWASPPGPAGRVSVLIVNYRAYRELGACLDSLGHQPDVREVVVVDQDSDEGQLRPLEVAHPGVTWLPGVGNSGFAAGVNRASKHASGPYLYLVNPDAIVETGVPAALAALLDERPDVAVAGSMVRESDGTIQGSARRFPTALTLVAGRTAWLSRRFPSNPLTRRSVLTGPEVKTPQTVDWVSGASMMVRRRAFDEVGGMDERYFLYWEDADFCRRLLARGWQTLYVPTVGVIHHGGRSSRAGLRPLVAFHQSAFRYFLRHAGPLGWLVTPLAAAALAVRLGLKLLERRGRGRGALS